MGVYSSNVQDHKGGLGRDQEKMGGCSPPHEALNRRKQ